MGENTALSGMKAIQDFCRSIGMPSAEATIMSLILNENFPAKKLGGIWESDKEVIMTWRKDRLTGNNNGSGTPKTEPLKNKLAKNGKQK